GVGFVDRAARKHIRALFEVFALVLHHAWASIDVHDGDGAQRGDEDQRDGLFHGNLLSGDWAATGAASEMSALHRPARTSMRSIISTCEAKSKMVAIARRLLCGHNRL